MYGANFSMMLLFHQRYKTKAKIMQLLICLFSLNFSVLQANHNLSHLDGILNVNITC